MFDSVPAEPLSEFSSEAEPVRNNFSSKHVMRREAVAMLKLLAPFLGMAVVVFSFQEFVINAIKSNVTINGLIIVSALYGVVLIVMRQLSAQKDFFIIERFGREAMQGVYMPKLLQEPWLQRTYVRHYLAHIAQTGGTLSSELQQSAIENELKALATEYEHKLELPQFISGFMVAMGLLGTFVGLLETLTGISGMLDGFGTSGASLDSQFMQLVVGLRKPLGGMGIAFSASMFGLVTSLMLAVMMINLRRYVSRVISCARNVMHDLTELGRSVQGAGGAVTQLTPEDILALSGGGKGTPKKPAAGSITEGDSSLQDLVYQVNDTSMMMANRIDGLTRKMDALLHSFESSVKSVQKQNDLLAFVPHIGEVNERMLEELKVMTSGQIEQQKFSQMSIDATIKVIQKQDDLSAALPHVSEIGEKILKEFKTMSEGQLEQHRLAQLSIDASTAVAQKQNELLNAAPHMGEIGERMLLELKVIADGQIEQQKLAQMSIDASVNAVQKQGDLLNALPHMGAIGEKLLKEFKVLADGQVEQQKLVHMAIDASINSIQKQNDLLGAVPHVHEIGERMLGELKVLTDGQIEQQKLAQMAIDTNNNATRAMGSLVESQREAQAGMAHSLRGLNDRLVKIDENTIALNQNLGGIKESFTKVGAYSEVAETVSAGIGQQTLLLETLVKEDRNLQKRLISIQQDMREWLQKEADEDAGELLPPV